MRFTLDKQGHELTDRCPVEPRVDVVDHVIDGARRERGIASGQSLNDLTQQGLLVHRLDHRVNVASSSPTVNRQAWAMR